MAVAGGLHGHQDPLGDIHPVVLLEGDGFAVYHQSNDPKVPERDVWHKQVHDLDGSLAVPRHRVPADQRERLEELLTRHYDQRLAPGPRVEVSKLAGDSAAFGLVQTNGGRSRSVLPVECPQNARVSQTFATETEVAFSWSTIERGQDALVGVLRVSLARSDGVAQGRTVIVGKACAIYDFPVASNLVWAAGRWWVAWVRDDTPADAVENDEGNRTYHTVLSCVESGTGKVSHEVLPGISHWNSHLSVATHGGWICVAWHASTDDAYPGHAKVVTAFQKLPPSK
jgi:hypothetical protein